jgi:hypothetical protein
MNIEEKQTRTKDDVIHILTNQQQAEWQAARGNNQTREAKSPLR